MIFFISLCHHITYPLPIPHNQAEVFTEPPSPFRDEVNDPISVFPEFVLLPVSLSVTLAKY